MATSNAILVATYQKALVALATKLARQLSSVEATQAQISGFQALIAQLEGKK